MFGRHKRLKATKVQTIEEIHALASSGEPVLIDFFQVNCAPCRVMDGIVDELADEFEGSAHVAKVDVTRVPGAADHFRIRSTPTFVLLATSERARRNANSGSAKVTQRWRASGLVRKDQLRRVLMSNGAISAVES